MAFTQADVDRIRTTIARGERTVQFADRSTTYRSMDELLQALAMATADVAAAAGRNKQSLGYATKGF